MVVLRSRAGPSPRLRPTWPVAGGAVALALTGLFLPLVPAGPAIGMHAPPPAFYPLLAAVLAGYSLAILAARANYRKIITLSL